MPKGDATWTLEQAVTFVRHLQEFIAPSGYHAGLLGSVLHKGQSTKDLDVVIFPVNTETCDHDRLIELLREFNLERLFNRAEVRRRWKKLGSDDTKHVEVWQHAVTQKRIDLFFLR